MVIFVKAWCCIFATFSSHRTLCATYFPNLRRKLLSYFSERLFFKLLSKNLVWQLKTEPNFVDKLCAEDTFSGKSVVKLKTEIKLCVKIYFAWQSKHCRKTLRWVFKFWKYYAAHNSGLKIWLVSGIFEMAQSLNLKFCVYLCWLGVGFSPHF